MLKEFNLINSEKIKELNKLIVKINKSKYKEIYFFPYNVYSRYLDLKIYKKKTIFVDNYLNKKKCIKPSNLKPNKDRILIVTDNNLGKNQKFDKRLNTISFKSEFQLTGKIDLDKKKKKNINLKKLFEYYNSDKAKTYKRLIFKDRTHNYGKFYDKYFNIIIDDGGHYKSHILNNMKNFFQCLKKNNSLYVIEDFGLKFNYLDDIKNEYDIFQILNFYAKKKFFKSKILDKNFQKNVFDNLTNTAVYQGDWTKYKKKISDICFLEFNNT
jgi:hypothetical protein